MLIQGYAMGMTIHAMAGYDEKKLLSGLNIPEPFRVAAIVAAGWRGKVESLPEDVRKRGFEILWRAASGKQSVNLYFRIRLAGSVN